MTDPSIYTPERVVWVYYKNWEGKIAWRTIVPIPGSVRYGTTQWHPESGWLMDVIDLDKQATRTFAMKDIMEWRTTKPEQLEQPNPPNPPKPSNNSIPGDEGGGR